MEGFGLDVVLGEGEVSKGGEIGEREFYFGGVFWDVDGSEREKKDVV